MASTRAPTTTAQEESLALEHLTSLARNHETDLAFILNQHFDVIDPSDIRLIAITPSKLTVNYAVGKKSTYLLRSTRDIAFSPPLQPLSADEAGARIADMAEEAKIEGALNKDGKSVYTIDHYRFPRGALNGLIVVWSVVKLSALVGRLAFLPGYPGHGIFESLLTPIQNIWGYRIATALSVGAVVTHAFEGALVLAPRLYKYNVRFGSKLWWRWQLGGLYGGATSFWTVDEMVKEQKAQRRARREAEKKVR